MHNIQKINTRFSQIGYNPHFGKIAFSDLAKNLKSEETILNVVEGSMNNFLGVGVATDLRIFYVGINKRGSMFLEQVSYEDVKSASLEGSQFVSVSLVIHTRNQFPFKIKGCEPSRAEEMAELINMLVTAN